MSDESDSILKKLKPLYMFALGVAVALGGERLIAYLKNKYEEHKEEELEELAERIIKKYKQETDSGSG